MALHNESRLFSGMLHANSFVYGCLCSSFSHNSSTGNWTLTESLLQGFRGDPAVDLDHNGRIALGELADYTELQMAFGERQKAVFLCSEGFEKRTLAAARGPHPQRLGEQLEVEWKGKWYRGQIIGIPEHGLRVHYIGFDNKWDEVVPESRTRPFRSQQLAPGSSVEVRWPEDQQWYPARILRGWQGIYFIHYEGYAPEWDEWVPPAAIRQPL